MFVDFYPSPCSEALSSFSSRSITISYPLLKCCYTYLFRKVEYRPITLDRGSGAGDKCECDFWIKTFDFFLRLGYDKRIAQNKYYNNRKYNTYFSQASDFHHFSFTGLRRSDIKYSHLSYYEVNEFNNARLIIIN